MLLEAVRPVESLITDITLEWFSSRVDAHVLFDSSRQRESSTTDITLYWFVSRVGPQVLLEVLRLVEWGQHFPLTSLQVGPPVF